MQANSYTTGKQTVNLSHHEGQTKPETNKKCTGHVQSIKHDKTKEYQLGKKESNLHLNLTVLQWLGLWPCNKDSMYFKALFLRITFCFAFTVQATINIVEIMDIIVNWGHLSNLTENIYTIGCSVMAIVKELTIIFKTKNIRSLVNILDNELAVPRKQGSPQQQEQIARTCKNQARMFTLIFISMCAFVGTSFSFVPFIDNLLGHSTTGVSSQRPMPYTAWFPFNVTETPAYELAYIYLSLETAYTAVYIGSCDALFVALIIHLCGQFQILQVSLRDIKVHVMKKVQATDKERIRSGSINLSSTELPHSAISDTEVSAHENDVYLDTTKADKSSEEIYLSNEYLAAELQHHLKECIKHHQILLKYLQELRYICTPFMVIQLLGSLILICVIVFNMATVPVQSVKFVSAVVFVMVAISQLFFLCWYSEELSIQSCDVYQAAYDCEWYDAPPSFKTSIQLIMRQAQKARTLTAANFCSVNMQTFTAIMRVSYSNYALLQRLHMENGKEVTQLE